MNDASPQKDEVSSQCSSSRSLDWLLLKETNSEDEIDEILQTKIPYNSIRSSHSKTNCKLRPIAKIDKHKMQQEIRKCKALRWSVSSYTLCANFS
ncbi:unnamed protein product [Brachionus calyciflorus]|uniref:Uncharacterized protein n=1 Tax=Brachionus calyciflorus TaxID=104777 RepID=A0A814N0B8_9BILA|nr:unnamed protein product [Brachionus calyciflorus]